MTAKKKSIIALTLILSTLLCSCGGENQSKAEQSEAISQTVENSEAASQTSESGESEEAASQTSESAESEEAVSETSESAESEISGTHGNVSWKFKTDTLTLSGNGIMNDYTAEDDGKSPWKNSEFSDKIKKIVIEEGITSIGNNAFSALQFEEISLPKTIKTIGSYAFSKCVFNKITLPDGLEEIGDHAFAECNNIKSIPLPDSVIVIGEYAFSSCVNLKSLSLPKNIKVVPAGIICYSTAMERITLPASVEKIETYAFVFNKLKTIAFEGTEEQWNEIEKEKNWFPGTSWENLIKFSK